MTDTKERALLRRLVELTGKQWLSRKGARALSGGVPYETGKFTDWEVSLDYAVDEVRRIAAEARALLAEPEGEPKPENVRLWRGKSAWTGKYVWFEQEPKPDEFLLTDLIPGTFIPDARAILDREGT